MPLCLVALGSNRGDPNAALSNAIAQLQRIAIKGSLVESARHETTPVGGPAGQSVFLNAVARFQTEASPVEVLEACQQTERLIGPRDSVRWSARVLDLDLLAYDDLVIETPALRVPHPRLSFRPFVLRPAAEVAPDWQHPELGATLAGLLAKLENPPQRVALCGARRTVELLRTLVEASTEPRGVALDVRESETLASGSPPVGLWIDATVEGLATAAPRLRIADCDPQRVDEEIAAAIECVWPARG
ncbi:2-amino-4-hydroxy-6-hydroxymethyldihydropteridine diphosphokinase [Botrimarina hoheduenensis]|uniref:2-amino-4-hydroxy-6-hydroxymethyldihydropteridine pyrophosphokinase n=1 Tax=Botrimarina hoheduenensis TaxID=2528000 RepID=A0A5C5W797_9BACT|nr:2-amino-4-hydroxy-6-hydroxymethyldihydropteridine diphosphokinase [Botrimarina hoheduenensis]TWT46560.1 2-amino-4-hydroxy-6-hydroxymethyldihydropteridine pyrophosphokinase [Botrimarina hoheduenensis]